MNQAMAAEEADARSEPKLREHLAAARRRRKPMLIAFGVGLLTAILLALLLPPRYQSIGTILIEQQELPSELVRSTVTSYADQRVQVISQRVMTTQNLLSIIRRYDLYPREQSREPREKLIERMRDDIQFKMISADVVDPRSGAPRKATIAFTVSYTSPTPDVAAKIANELTTLYLNENLTERNRLAQDAYGFLQTEGDRMNTQIQEIESKLATFKQAHYDELPELAQLNMQQLDRTQQELHEAESRRTSQQQQLTFLQAQFAQLKPDSAIYSDTGERIVSTSDRLKALRTKLASAVALYSPDHPDVVRLKREVAGLEAQVGSQKRPAETNDLRRTLEEAQGELAEAQKKYSPDHPDVQRLQRKVDQLQSQLDKEAHHPGAPAAPTQAMATATPNATTSPPPAAASASTSVTSDPAAATSAQAAAIPASSAPADSAPDTSSAPDNPAYIQIGAQVEALRNDLRAQDVLIARLRATVADFQRKIALTPNIEKEYRDLTRDYESAQLKYGEIRAKEMEAQVAQNLESDRKGERFTLIEPPLPPEDPVSPNRPLVLVLGLLLSIGLAVGIAALLEATDSTIRGHQDMLEAFGAPMLAVVPRIMTVADIALGRRRLQYTVATAAVVGISAILAIHFFYRPLDVLWFAAIRHLGY
jgi:succinoglycan biosynthesis transport protein ExoP